MHTFSTVSWFQRATLLVIAVIALSFSIACGGASSSTSSSVPPQPASKTTAQIKIGDAAADRIIAFEVTISSPITVTTSSGNLQIALSSNRLELSHMSAKFEPLTLVNAPQGTYTGATLTIANPEVTFLDNTGTPHTIEGSASQTVSLTFTPAVTIGASPLVNQH